MRIVDPKPYQATGVEAPWHRGWNLTDEERARFRRNSLDSQAAKSRALRGECNQPKHPIPAPLLRAEDLMPPVGRNQLKALSLFSGGGGLDIGFDRAGYTHVASFEIREDAAAVLREAQPTWDIRGGDEGDVCHVDWAAYKDRVDVLHGGPPCQPFSHAGYRSGADDVRDMFPQFVRAVKAVRPNAFVAENVSGLASKKFRQYVEETIFVPLESSYTIRMFGLEAASFGVPQRRRRIWFVGFRDQKCASRFAEPAPTHLDCGHLDFTSQQEQRAPVMGVRKALGLASIGYDALAPTIRSGFSGPRHSTSVVNSVSSLREWQKLRIWPHGVAENRQKAAAFVARDGDFRLSIPDCMLIQGFPADWPLKGAVYKCLGLLGNAVAPPMAYRVALAVAHALEGS